MTYKPGIQKITAFLMVLLFTISIAPKTYFHDLVADHKDFSDCRQLHHSTVLHHQGMNCHFDELVVAAPFLLVSQQQVDFIKFCFNKNQFSFYSYNTQSFLQHKENRGPPFA